MFDNRKGKLLEQIEKLFDKPSSSRQLNQFEIQFVTDRGEFDKMKDERETSVLKRKVCFFFLNEELCSSDRSGKPDNTQDVIGVQACFI